MKPVRVNKHRMIAQRDSVLERIEKITPEQISEIHRVSKIYSGIDGYPSGTGGGNSSNEISNPTLASVIRSMTQHPTADPRQVAARAVAFHIAVAEEHAEAAYRATQAFEASGESDRGRDTSVSECSCCDGTVTGLGNDRLRAGYCSACYAAWSRTRTERGRMDRLAFELKRRGEMLEEIEGIIEVLTPTEVSA